MNSCPACKKEAKRYTFSNFKGEYVCPSCMRAYQPPYMTLVRFHQGSYQNLWNLETGIYENIDKPEELEWCGWEIRSKQDSVYSVSPKVNVTVYHLEFFGTAACGRCVEYDHFAEDATPCLAAACKNQAVPFRKDISFPPEISRYKRWCKYA
jgi:hypothetical protein